MVYATAGTLLARFAEDATLFAVEATLHDDERMDTPRVREALDLAACAKTVLLTSRPGRRNGLPGPGARAVETSSASRSSCKFPTAGGVTVYA